MSIIRRIDRALRWQWAYHRSLHELRAYSPRELMGDLRLTSADLPGIAALEADQQVAAHGARAAG